MDLGHPASEGTAHFRDASAGEATWTWYCVRTKPKHEHIAAANVGRNLHLEVFYPRLQMERSRRGKMTWVTEPLFPCYMFVRCASPAQLDELRYAYGISSVVRFGEQAAAVPQDVVEGLQRHFETGFSVVAEERLKPGAEVLVAGGAFEGMQASVLRVLPARQRVEVLLEILGRPTTVQVDRRWVALQQESVADLVPFMAAA